MAPSGPSGPSGPAWPAWIDANHAYIAAVIELVEARLDALLGKGEDRPPAPERAEAAHRALAAAAAAMAPPPAFHRLRDLFELTPFQLDILMLAAAVELSGVIARRCAALHGDPRRGFATFGLALSTLPGAHWSALAPDAPLRRWRLVELGEGGLTEAPIRIDERILHELVGVRGLDDRLRTAVREPGASAPPDRLAASVDEVARCLGVPSHPTVVIARGSAEARVTVGCAALRQLGQGALVVRPSEAGNPGERELFITLVRREAMLCGAGLVIEHAAEEPAERAALVHALTAAVPGVVVATDGDFTPHGPAVHVALPALDAQGRRALWEQALGPATAGLDGVLDELVDEFRPEAEEILRLGEEWRCRFWAGEVAPEGAEHPLRARLRADNRARFAGLAQVIVPVAGTGDLVLPDAQADMIAQIEGHVRYRQLVLDDWGFARRDARGLGISALFHGPSGTGKTLAAEVIARRLGFDLVRVDLSQVVSKYIGETEKNLRRIFDAADRGGCVLLFDEADALFGKRSEVRDSHDRYANIEVGYLLQRIEAFRGLAILTTNLKGSLDPAFMRRLRFVVAFPFPDTAERRKIWERSLPPETPREGIDFDRVARLQVTGGNIRSIALHAAFLAAAERSPVRMRHLWKASRDECARIEKAVTAAEIGGWV
jgi:hypothetical protein